MVSGQWLVVRWLGVVVGGMWESPAFGPGSFAAGEAEGRLGGFALEGSLLSGEGVLGFEAGGGGAGERLGAALCLCGFFEQGLKFLLCGAEAGLPCGDGLGGRIGHSKFSHVGRGGSSNGVEVWRWDELHVAWSKAICGGVELVFCRDRVAGWA